MGSNISLTPLELLPWSMWDSRLAIDAYKWRLGWFRYCGFLSTEHWNFVRRMLRIRVRIHRLDNLLRCFTLNREVSRRSLRIRMAQDFSNTVMRMVGEEYTQSSRSSPQHQNE